MNPENIEFTRRRIGRAAKQAGIHCLWLVCFALAMPAAMAAADLKQVQQPVVVVNPTEGARALQVLASDDEPLVHDMRPSELAILKATGALHAGEPDQAISTLLEARKQDGALQNDALAAIIDAEAHRPSAIRAVARAGEYARSLSSEEQRLQEADLSSGLAEADQRLRAFMEHVDGVSGVPLALLDVSSSVKSVFLVDKGRSRMFVYERNAQGAWQRVADEYVVTGAIAGD